MHMTPDGGGACHWTMVSPASPRPRRQARHDTNVWIDEGPGRGVFDFIAFSVDRGTVTLEGYSFHGSLKATPRWRPGESPASTRSSTGSSGWPHRWWSNCARAT